MRTLFEIETADVLLRWRSVSKPKIHEQNLEGCGTLLVSMRRRGAVVERIWRADVVGDAADLDSTIGPPLFEQTEYHVMLKSKTGRIVDLAHPNPNIRERFSHEANGLLCFGAINFRSELGTTVFTVLIDGKPEFDFQLEVYPTKLDYKSDYQQIIAETNELVAGLAFDYLRSTYQLSFPNLPKQSGSVEWLLLLKMVIADLENAIRHIEKHPIRSLQNGQTTERIDKVRKVDSFIRAAVRRNNGYGEQLEVDGIYLRRQLPVLKHQSTLDSPEHRWISHQLKRIYARLVILGSQECSREVSLRRIEVISALKKMEEQVSRMRSVEPIVASSGLPTAGFASMQLMKAPGYCEAYKACTMLSLGLQIEGGPVNLSIKELNVLYEYWCYLTVLRVVSQTLKQNIPVGTLIKRRQFGLEVTLKKGIETAVEMHGKHGRSITVTYNKQIEHESMLISQHPDIMLSFTEPGWPPFNLLLDAKYRVKFDVDFIKQYRGPGPPPDAVNALHRYRDAILEFETGDLR